MVGRVTGAGSHGHASELTNSRSGSPSLSKSSTATPDPMVSGNSLSPTPPVEWTKSMPESAVMSVKGIVAVATTPSSIAAGISTFFARTVSPGRRARIAATTASATTTATTITASERRKTTPITASRSPWGSLEVLIALTAARGSRPGPRRGPRQDRGGGPRSSPGRGRCRQACSGHEPPRAARPRRDRRDRRRSV